MKDLDGKVAVITGGGGPGIGLAMAHALACRGCAVVIAEIDPERAKAAAQRIEEEGGQALAVPADVTMASEVDDLVLRAATIFGGIDILVNHASVSPGGSIEDITQSTWNRTLAVHLKSAFLCSRAVVPFMRRRGGGRIVSLSSQAAYRPWPGQGLSDYAAAMAGIVGFSRALATEVGGDRITVNVIAPGFVSDESAGAATSAGRTVAGFKAVDGHPDPSCLPITPREIAGALLYLVDTRADRVTGSVIHINGGSYFPN